MINKNHLDYINKELMNMDENTYSHYELYEWYSYYFDYRCFTEDDWENLRNLQNKKLKGWSILKSGDRSDEYDTTRFIINLPRKRSHLQWLR